MIRVDGVHMELGDEFRLSRVPDATQMQGLACELRFRLTPALAEGRPEAVAAALGWRFSARRIGSSDSPVQSLLVPLRLGGFSIVINTHHVWTAPQAVWLAAHEVGHSFFYEGGAPPRRIIPCSDREEQFCDDFADELLLGIGAPPTRRVA